MSKLSYTPTFHMYDEFPELVWVSIGGESVAYFRERTCHVESVLLIDGEYVPADYYEFEMECGGGFRWDWREPPDYCPNCGAKVVER